MEDTGKKLDIRDLTPACNAPGTTSPRAAFTYTYDEQGKRQDMNAEGLPVGLYTLLTSIIGVPCPRAGGYPYNDE
jgi:hypothetical protein